MEFSSDDSFAWTTDSQQGSDSDSEDMVIQSETNYENGSESQSFENTNTSERKVKKRKLEGHIESPKKKKIKKEKESDVENYKSADKIKHDDNSTEDIPKKMENTNRKRKNRDDVVDDDKNFSPIKPKEEFDSGDGKPKKSKICNDTRKIYKSIDDVTHDDGKYLSLKAEEEHSSRKKVTRKSKTINDNRKSNDDDTDNDRNYITMKAKEEELGSEVVESKKSKKVNGISKKHNPIGDVSDDDVHLTMKAKQELGPEEINETKKKKKRKSKEMILENSGEDINGAQRSDDGVPSIVQTPRISDRIIFEEDLSDIETPSRKNEDDIVPSRHLLHFLKENPNLKPVEKSSNAPSITENDEIWVLRCPNEMNVGVLTNKEINLGSQCKIKINGDSYYGVVHNECSRMAIMTYDQNQYVIKNKLCKGSIDFRKRIPKLHVESDGPTNHDLAHFIPLPETKSRHPLFGSDYKKAIKIPKQVAHRLKSSLADSSVTRNERKKKKKQEKQLEESVKVEQTESVQTEPESDVLTKKIKKEKRKERKKKHGEDMEYPKKTKKRSKHDLESHELWESETKIEESLFNF